MTTEARDVIDALDAILERERQILLAGDLDQMEDVLNAKEAMIDRLNAQEHDDAAHMTQLRDKLKRNQVLLNGALDGIRRTSARLATIRNVRRSLQTYDKCGNRKTIEGETDHKLERRA